MSKQKSQEVLNEAVEDFKGNEEEQSIKHIHVKVISEINEAFQNLINGNGS